MATKLEILLNTIFNNKGTEEAKAALSEVSEDLARISSTSLDELDVSVKATVDDAETREFIAEMQGLAPVLPMMADMSQPIASLEEIHSIAGEESLLPWRAEDEPIIATLAEIRANAGEGAIMPIYGDSTGDIAGSDEIQALAGSVPASVTMDVSVTGIEAATAGLENLQQLATTMPQIQEIVSDSAVQGTIKYAEALSLLESTARSTAQGVAALGESEEGELRKTIAAKNAAESLTRTIQELATISKEQSLAAAQSGMSLEQQIVALKKDRQAWLDLAKAAREAGQHIKGEVFEQSAQKIQENISKIDRLNKGFDETSSVVRDVGEEIRKQFEGITSLDQFSEKVKEIKKDLREQKEEVLKQGKAFDGTLDPILAQQRALEGLADQMVGTKQRFKLLGSEMEGFGGIMRRMMESPFNQFGFVMFITMNTIKSVINIFKSLKNAMIAIGDEQNFMEAFGSAMTRAGLATDKFRLSLNDAAGGFIAFAEAQKVALELNLRGSDAVTQWAGSLLEVSKKLAIATGGIQAFADTQQALMTALTTGDVSSLSEVLGFQDVPDELRLIEMAAERAGKPLTDMGRAEEGIRLTTAALDEMMPILADVEDAAANTRERVAALGDAPKDFFSAWGIILSDAFIDPAADAENSVKQAMANVALAMLDLAFMVYHGLGVMATPIVGLFKTIDAYLTGMGSKNYLDNVKASFEEWEGLIDETRARLRQTVEEGMGLLATPADSAIMNAQEELELFNKGLKASANLINTVFGDVLTQIDILDSPDEQLRKDLEEQEISHRERLEQIDQDSTEKINKIRDKGAEDWENAQKDYNDTAEEMADDLSDRIIDINDDNELKVARIHEDAEDRRNKEKKDNAKKLEDIEEDHQKKINDIMRKFDLSRLKSLIDRDARALYEAERNRDEDLRKAEEARKQKHDDEVESNQERLDDINDAEEKATNRANEDAQRRRDDAVKNHLKAMSDLQDHLEERHQLILEHMADQRLAEANEAIKRSNDEKAAYKKRTDKMKADFKETQGLLAAAAIQTRITSLSELSTTSDGYFDTWQEILADVRQFKTDYGIDIGEINQITATLKPLWGGGGGGGGDDGGDPGGSDPPATPGADCVPGYDITSNLNPNIACAKSIEGKIIQDCSGKRWACVNGYWTQMSGDVQQNNVQPAGGESKGRTANVVPSGGTVFTADLSGQGSNGNQVTIVVEGDKTLEQIFREISFSAYIETIT